MITIEKYNPQTDFDTIKSWGESRGLVLIPALLSQYGYILKENAKPKMAVWVYFFTDVPIVQLDHLCTEPNLGFKGIIYLKRLLNFIKEFINEIEKLSGNKFLMIRVFVKKEMKSGCEILGFTIDQKDGTIANLLLV